MPRIMVPQKKTNPEALVQAKIVKYLEARGWIVNVTHGNAFQSGFPDLWACHPRFSYRWIEVKDPNRAGKRSLFTPAQRRVFPLWAGCGIGIWVLTGADQWEYDKLFRPANWYTFL